MDKLLDSASFFEDDVQVKLLLEGGLTKVAMAEEVGGFVNELQPKSECFYLHINAMGAGEVYGSNRNGDYFPEEQLIKWHKTFETSPAHVFRHHVNKDPAKAIGKVIFSYYNPRMKRVELIAEVDKELGRPEYEAIKSGKYPHTSMACNTPYDVCSICGNKAHNRAQYCVHLNSQLNQMAPDGRKVMALNLGPLKFFDISIVIRPADVTSSVLQKVANHQGVVGSAEEALALDLDGSLEKASSIKKEAIEKVSDLIKQVDGQVEHVDDNLQGILDRIEEMDVDLIPYLAKHPIEEVLNAMAELALSPSLKFLSTLIATKYLGEEHSHIGPISVDLLKERGLESIPEDYHTLLPDIQEKSPDPILIKVLSRYVEGSSIRPDFIEKRSAYYRMPDMDRSSKGYANWDVGREGSQPQVKEYLELNQSPDLIGRITAIAGNALLAKMVLAGLIHTKTTKQDNNWLKSYTGNLSDKSPNVVKKILSAGLR